MATIRQIRESLETVLKAFSAEIDEETVTLTLVDRYVDANHGIPPSSLPAFFVSRAGRAEHELSGDDRFTSRRLVAWIVAAEFGDDNPIGKENADEQAEDLIDPIVDFLFQNLTLDHLAGVQGLSIRDDGVKQYDRASKHYSAIPILIDVGSIRNPWSET